MTGLAPSNLSNAVQATPLAFALGARIDGVRIDQPLAPSDRTAIEQAWEAEVLQK